jgi:hypothetical protein
VSADWAGKSPDHFYDQLLTQDTSVYSLAALALDVRQRSTSLEIRRARDCARNVRPSRAATNDPHLDPLPERARDRKRSLDGSLP